ncbi:hypothetical protein H257_06836 [Aphanomyces astaci]|uniref:Uncharacterized protein n=1 Tax=Aphanomyces astaci TaxID=112090 RepID=W4GJT2_APHAT|nr:hypothetical protein H257_06836 [Aphanomyces astaci]ETV79576.1 hypothetical protein H257_06836 [Aphanomyces astaci]|eukprot:XP_009830512.1 hypothetical protein H257_06836 [Aphanomyces astaci]
MCSTWQHQLQSESSFPHSSRHVKDGSRTTRAPQAVPGQPPRSARAAEGVSPEQQGPDRSAREEMVCPEQGAYGRVQEGVPAAEQGPHSCSQEGVHGAKQGAHRRRQERLLPRDKDQGEVGVIVDTTIVQEGRADTHDAATADHATDQAGCKRRHRRCAAHMHSGHLRAQGSAAVAAMRWGCVRLQLLIMLLCIVC